MPSFLSKSVAKVSARGIFLYKTDEFLETWKDQNGTYLGTSEQLRIKNVNYV